MFKSEECLYCFRLFRLGGGMDEESANEGLKQRISESEIAAKTRDEEESDKTYRVLFEKSKDAILIIKNEQFIDCNQATLDMLGYKNKSKLLKTHPSELSPDFQSDGKESFTKAKEMMAVALKNGGHRFEWNHIRANGDVFPVEVLLTAISNQEGNQVIHTIWRDITNRVQAEKARQEEKETLSTILESTPHGITLIDNYGKYLYVNPYFTKITGYTLKDIPTKEVWFDKAYPDKVYRKNVTVINELQENEIVRCYQKLPGTHALQDYLMNSSFSGQIRRAGRLFSDRL